MIHLAGQYICFFRSVVHRRGPCFAGVGSFGSGGGTSLIASLMECCDQAIASNCSMALTGFTSILRRIILPSAQKSMNTWSSGLCVALSSMALCQPVERVLLPSSSVTETLAGTADVAFTLATPANQTLELQVIEQRGDAGLFSILRADGSELASLDPDPRTNCVKRILIPPGAARILVRPL